ncbi:MAG: DUF748 domain-containing protein [Fibrobacterota bacterium]|nr:DUF748 domain-containing protein [Fibrobacterota bacterium]
MIIPDSQRKNSGPKKPVPSHRMRKSVIWIGAIILILIGIRAAMPPVILHLVNRKLDRIPEYSGHIGDVDLALFRGAYQIKDIALAKSEGAASTPFFSADLVDLSVEWGALMRRAFVGEVEMYNPRLNFVVAPTKKSSQTGIDSSWEDRSKELFPLDINRFVIHDGSIHFRDLTRTPKVDIHIDRIETLAKGLTTHPHPDEALPATFHATGRAMNHAKVRVDIKLNPTAQEPTFDRSCRPSAVALRLDRYDLLPMGLAPLRSRPCRAYMKRGDPGGPPLSARRGTWRST